MMPDSTAHNADQPTETRVATVSRDKNGIIVITMKKSAGQVDEYDMTDVNLVIRNYAQSQAALKLVVLAPNVELTKKAREIAEKEDNLSLTRARAVVVSGTVKASFMNLLLQFNLKDYPQQFFTNRHDAYEWLQRFNQEPINKLEF
jgi:hypothetical protein